MSSETERFTWAPIGYLLDIASGMLLVGICGLIYGRYVMSYPAFHWAWWGFATIGAFTFIVLAIGLFQQFRRAIVHASNAIEVRPSGLVIKPYFLREVPWSEIQSVRLAGGWPNKGLELTVRDAARYEPTRFWRTEAYDTDGRIWLSGWFVSRPIVELIDAIGTRLLAAQRGTV